MTAFVEKNGDTRAVGNAPMNARGDIIDARGNVKIPTQTISRAVANIKNNESTQVSLKADETISPVQNAPIVDNTPTIVSTKEVTTMDGVATEVEYSDGSIQIIPKVSQTPPSL
jgi:hypothetical protein